MIAVGMSDQCPVNLTTRVDEKVSGWTKKPFGANLQNNTFHTNKGIGSRRMETFQFDT
jgi:hypothetical protein